MTPKIMIYTYLLRYADRAFTVKELMYVLGTKRISTYSALWALQRDKSVTSTTGYNAKWQISLDELKRVESL